jgi:hypothetical protein
MGNNSNHYFIIEPPTPNKLFKVLHEFNNLLALDLCTTEHATLALSSPGTGTSCEQISSCHFTSIGGTCTT